MTLELNLTEEQKKHAEFFKVEEGHYQGIIEQSDNLKKDNFYLSLGVLFSDCIKFKIAAEQLGYNAEEVGSSKHGGYPDFYFLTKQKKEGEI
jgi:hypothetical protein